MWSTQSLVIKQYFRPPPMQCNNENEMYNAISQFSVCCLAPAGQSQGTFAQSTGRALSLTIMYVYIWFVGLRPVIFVSLLIKTIAKLVLSKVDMRCKRVGLVTQTGFHLKPRGPDFWDNNRRGETSGWSLSLVWETCRSKIICTSLLRSWSSSDIDWQ